MLVYIVFWTMVALILGLLIVLYRKNTPPITVNVPPAVNNHYISPTIVLPGQEVSDEETPMFMTAPAAAEETADAKRARLLVEHEAELEAKREKQRIASRKHWRKKNGIPADGWTPEQLRAIKQRAWTPEKRQTQATVVREKRWGKNDAAVPVAGLPSDRPRRGYTKRNLGVKKSEDPNAYQRAYNLDAKKTGNTATTFTPQA